MIYIKIFFISSDFRRSIKFIFYYFCPTCYRSVSVSLRPVESHLKKCEILSHFHWNFTSSHMLFWQLMLVFIRSYSPGVVKEEGPYLHTTPMALIRDWSLRLWHQWWRSNVEAADQSEPAALHSVGVPKDFSRHDQALYRHFSV